MDISATSLCTTGLRDWLVQRVSAVILALYIVFILGFILWHPGLDFFTWRKLFALPLMKVFSVLVLLSLLVHAWVGMWTITGDYLKAFSLRLLMQLVIILALCLYFIWGVLLLWSV